MRTRIYSPRPSHPSARRAALAPAILIGGEEHLVIVSIGWVLATPGEPVRELLARADAAMYETKARAKASRRASLHADR